MNKSLPAVLFKSLEQHASASDIEFDVELQDIMQKLSALNAKVEAVKQKAIINRSSNVVDFNRHTK